MASASSRDCLEALRNFVDDPNFKRLTQNKHIPIVLVPGFSGWGAPLLGALNYWGGIEDIPKLLLENGYTVIVSSIAPLSSNWERACELYQQLTCGKFVRFDADDDESRKDYDLEIDYGQFFDDDRSRAPKSTKTAKRKRAILFTNDVSKYKNWIWSDGHKAHFICHSQGGTTIRLLLSLLANGDTRHQDYFGTPGRDNWAVSVTTIGTPHKGTTICDSIQKIFSASPAARDQAIVLLGRLFATLSYKVPALQTFDLQLDHWEIGRNENESFQEMRTRLERIDGPVRKWSFSRHNAFYDNSIEGVNELPEDTRVPSPNTYYFTLSFHATAPFPSEYPHWAPEAAGTFPITLLQFAHAVLQSIPAIGGLADWILTTLVSVSGWTIFSSNVRLRDLSVWVTRDVVQRLLRSFGYNLILPNPGRYLPRQDVIPLMLPTVYAIGGHDLSEPQKRILGSGLGDWYLSDGIVNTESMNGPIGAEIFDFAEFPTTESDIREYGKGRYWHLGVNDKMDHADEIGVWVERTTADATLEMYKNIVDLVSRLPADISPREAPRPAL